MGSKERSWVPTVSAVKQRPRRSARGWRAHLEGWQLGLVLVGTALVSAVVAAPRRVVPDAIPLPLADRGEQRRELREQETLARAAESVPLSYDTRAVGESIRRFGVALAAGDASSAEALRAQLRRQVEESYEERSAELLQLRAVQMRMFLEAIHDWEREGVESTDLAELGGGFLETAEASGWITREPRRVVLRPIELAVLFKVRWTKLVGLEESPEFRISLNDFRAYYRLLLQRPEGGGLPDQRRLAYVAAVEQRDLEYPSNLAKGVLFYRLGAYRRSVDALRAHVDSAPNGDWSLRARNYLAEANARAAEAGVP